MANPSYSLDNSTFITLTGKYRFGGEPRSIRRKVIDHEVENGARFVYTIFERRKFRLLFFVLNSQMSVHTTFDAAVAGAEFPFYLSISGVGAADSVLVRKIGDSDFNPRERDQPGSGAACFDIEYDFEEEII